MAHEYSIGELSGMTATGVPTIRYYERIGLLPRAGRTAGNQRRYVADQVARLRFIRHARDLGFSQDAVRDLLRLKDQPEHSCADADGIARRHLNAVNDRIVQLLALRVELERMIAACAGGVISECRIIEALDTAAPAERE